MMGEGPNPNGKWSKYAVDDEGNLVRKSEFCPRCKEGVFMAKHSDRKSCGRCGYTASNESESTDLDAN